MRKLRAVVAVFVVILVGRWLGCGTSRDPGPVPQLTNRVWADKIPDGPRDMVLRLVLVKKGRMKRGVISTASQYRLVGDRLGYSVKGDQLILTVPQDESKLTFKARVHPCRGPGRFDLCLDLTRGRQKLRLYSEKRTSFAEDAIDAETRGLGLDLEPAESDPVDAVELTESTARGPAWFLDRAVLVN